MGASLQGNRTQEGLGRERKTLIPEFRWAGVKVRILGIGQYLFRSRDWRKRDVWHCFSDNKCTCKGWTVRKTCCHVGLAKQIDESIARLSEKSD